MADSEATGNARNFCGLAGSPPLLASVEEWAEVDLGQLGQPASEIGKNYQGNLPALTNPIQIHGLHKAEHL